MTINEYIANICGGAFDDKSIRDFVSSRLRRGFEHRLDSKATSHDLQTMGMKLPIIEFEMKALHAAGARFYDSDFAGVPHYREGCAT